MFNISGEMLPYFGVHLKLLYFQLQQILVEA